MLKGLFIILLLLFLGEVAVHLIGLPIPGSIIGMLMTVGSLHLKIIKLTDIKPVSDKLIKYLALFFVPPGVGLIAYSQTLGENWHIIITAASLSTFLVLLTTGYVFQWLRKP